MSRTYKDRPIFVKIYDMMKKGEYQHMHFFLNRPRVFVKEETVKIEKKNAQEIYEFRKYLLENNIDFAEEEKKAVRDLKFDSEPGSYALVNYELTPKMIEFTYEKEYTYGGRFSRYCTDVEHYDVRNQTDTRDGKVATCTPFPNHIGGKQGCGCCDCESANNKGKTKREAAFRNIAKAYNNGTDYESLDEFENDSFWV